MKDNEYREALKKEREKLEHLIDEALKKDMQKSRINQCEKRDLLKTQWGSRALQNEEIQKQSRKIDGMIMVTEREEG